MAIIRYTNKKEIQNSSEAVLEMFDSIVCDSIVCDSIVCDSIVCDSIVCDSIVCDSIVCDSPAYVIRVPCRTSS